MSKNEILVVEGLGKQYRLGEVGTGTISHDLNRWWAKVRGKEDPYSKIGETNDRTQEGSSEYVWALKDVSFSLNQGEVLGVVGKNGAGKSTLLKLLSKVTGPSAGTIKYRGRIAALLEVGTGFHPELTGRENVYLNGAILGMTKSEVKQKFDEIVEFAGVQRYIDTPVKRYSSGMMVRLGFAVAAHLEPEILIVDEVLAVGDFEFQKKCLGKMDEVSKTGRTILFVSHNMASIKALCNRAILLENGALVSEGSTEQIVKEYYQRSSSNSRSNQLLAELSNSRCTISEFSLSNPSSDLGNNMFFTGDTLEINMRLSSEKNIEIRTSIYIYDSDERLLANIENFDCKVNGEFFLNNLQISGEKSVKFSLFDLNLYPGIYKVGFWIGDPISYETIIEKDVFTTFEIVDGSTKVSRKLGRGLLYFSPEISIS